MNRDIRVIELLAPSARTSSGNGSSVDVQQYVYEVEPVQVFLTIGAVSGTTPTLDVKVQESSDGSTWTDVTNGAFAQKTATGNDLIAIVPKKRYLRVSYTIAGTSPSFTFAVEVLARRKMI